MKRTLALTFCLLLILSGLGAEGRREQPDPTIGEDDTIRVTTDAPDILIKRHSKDDSLRVVLNGRGSDSYRLSVRSERDGVAIEVKKKQRIGLFIADLFDTDLVLSVPESWTDGNLEVESISGSIVIEDFLEARAISIGSVSGSISFIAFSADHEIEVESVSGSIKGKSIESGSLQASSVSGAIMIDRVSVFNGEEDLQVETVSGAIKLGETSAGNAHISSISGSVHLTLTPRFEGTVTTTSLSGAISAETSQPHTVRSEKHTHSLTIGDAYNSIELSTTSGSIRIIQ